MDFHEMFATATEGAPPFDWQVRAATSAEPPKLLRLPTGAGKTEGAWLGWLWRRRFASQDIRGVTARRLVYCLPMRTLVEQTAARITAQRDRLGLDDIRVHVLMGGAVARDWIDRPEDDAVLVGTLDQLLSRALMRGYGVAPFRWPIEFALLHNDAEWVLDEVQLFGEALVTSTQLEGFRASLPSGVHPARTCWMSATVERDWLASVDHPAPTSVVELSDADRSGPLRKRLEAVKRLAEVPSLGAEAVRSAHRKGTLTLVVVNTVARAQALHKALTSAKGSSVPTVLVHSRFRPQERREAVAAMLAPIGPEGRIVVSTQVVEAGVDISAATLISEAAPWASMVQRFGRCNRTGDLSEARVLWCSPISAAPYEADELEASVDELRGREAQSVAPCELDAPTAALTPPARRHVIRRRDFLGLFDTSPDLSGLPLDISRFVRDTDDVSGVIAWRDLGGAAPRDDAPALARDELCPVSLADLAKAMKRKNCPPVYRFDPVAEAWTRVPVGAARPGDRLLTDSSFACYRADVGFEGSIKAPVPAVPSASEPSEGFADDPMSSLPSVWLTIAQHTDGVVAELDALLARIEGIGPDDRRKMIEAGRLHDWGKAHPVFQATMRRDAEVPPRFDDALLAKRGAGPARHERRGFRHELASALAYLSSPDPDDLVAYLVASHHGRVRLGARSLPTENTGQAPATVLGCAPGDELPDADLGGGRSAAACVLSLDVLQLGSDHGSTYTDRALRLLDDLGPFRLAFLEALLRTADTRRSALEQTMEVPDA